MNLSSPQNLLIAALYYALVGLLTFFSIFGVYVLIRYGKSIPLALIKSTSERLPTISVSWHLTEVFPPPCITSELSLPSKREAYTSAANSDGISGELHCSLTEH